DTGGSSKVSDHNLTCYDPFTLSQISGPFAFTQPADAGGFSWDFNQAQIVSDQFRQIRPAPDGDLYWVIHGERTSDSAHAAALGRFDGNTGALKDFTVTGSVVVTLDVDPPSNSPSPPDLNRNIFIGFRTDSFGLPSVRAIYTEPIMDYEDQGGGFGTHPRKFLIYPGASVNSPLVLLPDDDYDDGTGQFPNFRSSSPPPVGTVIHARTINVDGQGQLWTIWDDQVASPDQLIHLLFNEVGLIKRQNVTTMFDSVTPASQMATPRLANGCVYVKSINRFIFWTRISSFPDRGAWIFHVNPETLVVTDEYKVPETAGSDFPSNDFGPLGYQSATIPGAGFYQQGSLYNTNPTQDIVFQLTDTKLFRYNPESRSATFPIPIVTAVPAQGVGDRGDTFYNWQRNAYSVANRTNNQDWEFYNLDRVTQGIATLRAIVDDIIDQADSNIVKTTGALDDLITGDINAPGRHDVLGFSIQNRESARQTLEMLGIPFMFHLIERGSALVAIDRIGDAPAGEVVPKGDLGSYEAGTAPP
ncbi:hypothetical protein LCGC14_2414990, partial [marine sediment metagenome]